MIKQTVIVIFSIFILFNNSMADQLAIDTLLKTYLAQGAKPANALKGQKLWLTEFPAKGQFSIRSCSSCHTGNLRHSGKHLRTGKMIKPLSVSINKQSMNNIKKIKKWLKRNCKWTLGRECNVQEKSDLLAFIKHQ
jgi:Domain of unknown function (DUF1924)